MKYCLYSLLAGMMFFCSCSPSIQVHSDFDSSIDIVDYRYYTWLPEANIEAKGMNPLYYNELNDKRIKKAVNEQLQMRGYIPKETAAQIDMHYHIIVENKTMTIKEPVNNTYGTYWLNRTSNTYPYQEGTLIIDLMDAKTKSLVWRGWATGVIEQQSRDNPEKAIRKAISEIFKKFPFNFR